VIFFPTTMTADLPFKTRLMWPSITGSNFASSWMRPKYFPLFCVYGLSGVPEMPYCFLQDTK
jgi:hypothetical protein